MPRFNAGWLLTLGGAAASLALAACGGRGAPAVPAPTGSEDDLGSVVYVDQGGCIVRVPVSPTTGKAAQYCPATRSGVTAVTWMDTKAVSFTTPETRALGWRLYDFTTGEDRMLPMVEAPRVLFIGAPQYYSIRGEQLEIDESGVIHRLEPDKHIAIFTPTRKEPVTRLLTWSPDGEWVLFTQSVDKEIWAVRRDGTGLRELAGSSRGQASWFMPAAGAMPHADLTCSLPTEATWNCKVDLRAPAQFANVDPILSQGRLDIAWSACPGVTGYELQVLPVDSDSPLVSYIAAGTAYHTPLEPFPNGLKGEWRWRVRSLIGTQQGPWSEVRTFVIGPSNLAAAP